MILLTFVVISTIIISVVSYRLGYYTGRTDGYEHAIRMMKDEES